MFEYKERGMYAVLPGAQVFMIFLGYEKNDEQELISFMQIPQRYKISFEKDELQAFLNIKQLDFIEQLPQDVFEVCTLNVL